MKSLCAAVAFGCAALLGFCGTEGGVGRPINDRDAQGMTGGGCNSWTSGSVMCNSTGQVLCSGSSVNCNTVAFSSLITNGAGQNVENSTNDKTCFPCSNNSATCGTAHIVVSTKNGNCGT